MHLNNNNKVMTIVISKLFQSTHILTIRITRNSYLKCMQTMIILPMINTKSNQINSKVKTQMKEDKYGIMLNYRIMHELIAIIGYT